MVSELANFCLENEIWTVILEVIPGHLCSHVSCCLIYKMVTMEIETDWHVIDTVTKSLLLHTDLSCLFSNRLSTIYFSELLRCI